ncbi:MAG: crossover junction endodeoxyribonuclease RuvC, partial [Firmicutes bacterium]|nr:crossover junction endodeoxyribonuclease RuvC [Bacillota bacterium]
MKSQIVGCDPGTAAVGYGVLEATPGRHRALAWGVLRTEAGADLAERLRDLHRRFGTLL